MSGQAVLHSLINHFMAKDKNEKNGKDAKKTSQPPMSAREEWAEFLKTALIAVVLALLIRTFFLEPFNIPSGSMKPTLLVGDYLFVNKPAYGYSQHSFPFSAVPIEGRVGPTASKPRRGDVIVFKLPSNPRIDYIKRVVGLPGEQVQVINGELFINRERVPRKPLGIRQVENGGRMVPMVEYIETLPGNVKHRIYEESDNKALDNTQEFVVPEGHYFVMGDNRDNSQDSRVQSLVGFVPYENIVGRASFIFFSTNGFANIAEVWKWPGTIRYGRLLQGIGPER